MFSYKIPMTTFTILWKACIEIQILFLQMSPNHIILVEDLMWTKRIDLIQIADDSCILGKVGRVWGIFCIYKILVSQCWGKNRSDNFLFFYPCCSTGLFSHGWSSYELIRGAKRKKKFVSFYTKPVAVSVCLWTISFKQFTFASPIKKSGVT